MFCYFKHTEIDSTLIISLEMQIYWKRCHFFLSFRQALILSFLGTSRFLQGLVILTTVIYFPSKGWEKQRKIDCIVYREKKDTGTSTGVNWHRYSSIWHIIPWGSFPKHGHWSRPCPNFCCNRSVSRSTVSWKHHLFLLQSLALGEERYKSECRQWQQWHWPGQHPMAKEAPLLPKFSLHF